MHTFYLEETFKIYSHTCKINNFKVSIFAKYFTNIINTTRADKVFGNILF